MGRAPWAWHESIKFGFRISQMYNFGPIVGIDKPTITGG